MRTRKMSELLTQEEMQLLRLCIPLKDIENNTYNDNYLWTKEKMYELVVNEIEEHKKFKKELREKIKEITDKKQLELFEDYFNNSDDFVNKLEDLRHKIAYLLI